MEVLASIYGRNGVNEFSVRSRESSQERAGTAEGNGVGWDRFKLGEVRVGGLGLPVETIASPPALAFEQSIPIPPAVESNDQVEWLVVDWRKEG